MFARAEYQEWLIELANNTVKLKGVNANPLMGSAHGDLYYEHPFLLSCEGDLEQLVQFLYEFYQADYLHRIKRVTAQPIPDTKRLKLGITVEALSLIDRLQEEALLSWQMTHNERLLTHFKATEKGLISKFGVSAT